jgi:hypothetical protein
MTMTREQWFLLPNELRHRWWIETEFDRKPPPPDLLLAVARALVEAQMSQAAE